MHHTCKSDACWFLLKKTLLIKNNKKKRGGAKKMKRAGTRNMSCFLLGLIHTLYGIVADVPPAFYVLLRPHSLTLQIGEFTLGLPARGSLSGSSFVSIILSELLCGDNPPMESHDFRSVALISRLSNSCCHVRRVFCSVADHR